MIFIEWIKQPGIETGEILEDKWVWEKIKILKNINFEFAANQSDSKRRIFYAPWISLLADSLNNLIINDLEIDFFVAPVTGTNGT